MKHFEQLTDSNLYAVVTMLLGDRRLWFIRPNLNLTQMVDCARCFATKSEADTFAKEQRGVACNLSDLVISIAPIGHLVIGAIVFKDTAEKLEREHALAQAELLAKKFATQFESLERTLRYSLPYTELTDTQKGNYFKLIHQALETNIANPKAWVTEQLKGL